jgi:hypothetical protein
MLIERLQLPKVKKDKVMSFAVGGVKVIAAGLFRACGLRISFFYNLTFLVIKLVF